jgi:uroporphyrinogen decarboxylase
MSMDGRDRVLTTLDHREPDRVPFDLGSTIVTGIHVGAYEPLRSALGLPPSTPRILDRIQHLAVVDDDVRDALGVDTGGAYPGGPVRSHAREGAADGYALYWDDFGLGYRMPLEGGLYHDLFEHPLAGDDVTAADIASHPGPDPQDPGRVAGMRETCLRIRDEEHRAVCVWGFGGGVLETASWLRGLERFFLDLAADPDLACALMDRVLEWKLAYYERVMDEIGDLVDVFFEGDDLGTQQSLLISPETYRRYVKPRQAEIFRTIHERSAAKVALHSCGAVRPLIPDFIEIGVDVLNPVQVSAFGMDPAALKREFGSELVFWGGGVDTQRVLGFGTPGEVRDEVRRRLDDLMPGGGFVFATVHNIQANVPPENVLAMREALREHGAY